MESYNIVKFGIFDDFSHSFNKETITNVLALSHKEFFVSTNKQLYLIDKDTVKKKFPLRFSTFTIAQDKDFLIGTMIKEGDLNIYKLSDFLRKNPSNNSKSSPNTSLSTFSTNQTSISHIFYSEKSNVIITIGSGVKVFSIKYKKSDTPNDNSADNLANDLNENSTGNNLVITKRSSFSHNYTAPVMTAPAFDKETELILLPTENGIIGYDLNGAKICRCTKNPATIKTIYATYPTKPSKLAKLISLPSTNLLKRENLSLSKEILTYDSSDGMNLWGNKGQLINHYDTIRSSVLSIIFIDSENAICINSCNILFYLNIKTGKTFYYMNLEKSPSRLFLTYAKNEPVLCACFGSYLRVLKLVIPWKVWNLNLEKTLSIRRFNKFMSAARVLIDAENSFIKFYSPRNGKQLCIANINESYRPVSYFYDRGIVENHVFNEQSLSYEPKVTKINDNETNGNDRDILFIILQNGGILGFNPIESNCENISEINCKAAFMTICKISNQKSGFQWCYAVASEKGDLFIFDYFSMKEIMHYNVDDDVLVQLFFEFDSNLIVMVFASKTILFDIEKGKIIDTIQINGNRLTTLFANFLMYGFDTGHIRRVGIENKKFVFYNNENKKVNRDNKTEIVLKKPHSCPITGFSFAQKIWISSGLDGNIVIWNYDFKIVYKIYLPLPLRSCLIMNGKLEILVATATEIMQIKNKSLYRYLKKEDKIDTEINEIDNFDLIIDDFYKKSSEEMISDDESELEDEYDDEDFEVEEETANDDSKQKLNRNDNESNNFTNNSVELSTAPLSKLLPNSNATSSPSKQNKTLNPSKSNNNNKTNQEDDKCDSQKVNEKKGKDNSQSINNKNSKNEKDSTDDKSTIDKNNSNSKVKNDKNSTSNKNNTASNDKTKENADKSKSADKEKSNSTEKDKANSSTKTKPSSGDKNSTANKNKTTSDDKEHSSSNTSDKSKTNNNDKAKSTTGDKSKTNTGDKTKSTTGDKAKSTTGDKSKTNTGDKTKSTTSDKSKTNTNDKTKSSSDDKEKTTSGDKTKTTSGDKTKTTTGDKTKTTTGDKTKSNTDDKAKTTTGDKSKTNTGDKSKSNTSDKTKDNSDSNDKSKESANKKSSTKTKDDSDNKENEKKISKSNSKLNNESSNNDENQENTVDKDNKSSKKSNQSKSDTKKATSSNENDNSEENSKVNDNSKSNKISKSNSKADSDSKSKENTIKDSKSKDNSTKDINDNSNSDSKSNSKDNNKVSASNSKTDNDSSSSKTNDKDKVSSSNSKVDDVSESKADSNKLNDSKSNSEIIDSSNDENKKVNTNENEKVSQNEEIDQSNIENKDDNANNELKEDNKNDEKNDNEENNAIDSSISNATNDQSNEESNNNQIDQNNEIDQNKQENDQNIMNNENNEIDQNKQENENNEIDHNKQENDQNKLTNENNEADQIDKTNENDKENDNNKIEQENENNELNQNTDENENKQENENENDNANNQNDESGSSVDMEGIVFLDEIDQNKENDQNTASNENDQNNENEINQNEEQDQDNQIINDNENQDNPEDAQNGNEEDNAEPISNENEGENEKENANEEENQNENDETTTPEDQQTTPNNDNEDDQNNQKVEEVPFTGQYVRVPPPNVVIDKDELFDLYEHGRREFKPLVDEVLHEEEILDNWHRNLQYVQNMTNTISSYDEYQKQKQSVKGFTLNPKSPKHAHSARARRIDSPRDTFITENSKSITMETNPQEKISRRTTTPPASPSSSNRSSLPKIKNKSLFYPASYVHNYNNNYDTQSAIATPRLFGHFSSINNMVDEVDSNKNKNVNNDFSPYSTASNSPRQKAQLPPLLYSQPINSDAQIESPSNTVRSPSYNRTAPSPRRQLKQTV